MTSSSAVDNTIETPVGSKPWDEAIADLLSEISDAQAELLAVLSQKRQVIAAGDFESLPQFDERERSLAERLTQCLDGRRALLDAAAAQGLPGGSMKQLAAAVPAASRRRLAQGFDESESQSRLLSHQCLTNWVLSQQWLLHLGQCLEIIATGGRIKPTYSKEEPSHARGAGVDHAA